MRSHLDGARAGLWAQMAVLAVVLAACGGASEADGNGGDFPAEATTSTRLDATTTSTPVTTTTTAIPVITTTTASPEPCRLEADGRITFEGGLEWLVASDASFAPLELAPEEIARLACDVFDGMLAEVEPAVILQEIVDELGMGLTPDTPMMPASATLVFHPAEGEQCEVFGAIWTLARGVDLAYRGPAAHENSYFDTLYWCDG